ncbi:Ger(x)C family spore germination protein [Longirhabdus pacifica]|uniref:Ger(x)C family spore germination protein n=1 Tax=Longirhabdus pacifica TaxID=2305227 RepID=UPI001F0C6C88|nr:Ger(x)C family spore germination protein [Longirhabdus pacifica]
MLMRKICFSLFILLLLTGCWDRNEVNDIAIVAATGFDMEDSEDQKYRVSFQIPLPGELAGRIGQGSGDAKAYYVDSEAGNILIDIDDTIQSRISRKLTFSHRRVILIGEKLAKDGIGVIFDPLARIPQNRMSANIVVVTGKAYSYLNIDPSFESFSGETMRELAQSQNVYTQTLKDAVMSINHPGIEAAIPMMTLKTIEGAGEDKVEIELNGYAQFKEDKLVGTYEGDAAQGLLWLKKNIFPNNTTFAIEDNLYVVVNNQKANTTIHPTFTDEGIDINVKLSVESSVVENTSLRNLFDKHNLELLETKLKTQIEKQINQTIASMQEKGTDTIGVGVILHRKHHLLWNEKYKYNWSEYFSNATFNIELDTKITNIGFISENLSKEEQP